MRIPQLETFVSLLPAEFLTDQRGAGDAALGGVHFFAGDALEVGGLGEQEEFVDGGDVDGIEAAEVDAHAEV